MLVFLVIAYCLLVSLSLAKEYYVTSKIDKTDCPSERSCELLSFYTNEIPSKYFHNDTVFKFLEGTHLLERSLIISGVSSISLTGEERLEKGFNDTVTMPTTVITCLNGIGNIVFNIHSSNIVFSFITIQNCGNDTVFERYFRFLGSAALIFDEVFNIILDHLAIVNSTGNGLIVRNGYGTQIQSSTFAYNGMRNVLLLFTSPLQCFVNAQSYNVSVVSSRFSFGQKGLGIEMGQTSAYCVKTVIENIIAHNNSLYNIGMWMLDGQPHSLDMTNVSSSYGRFGFILRAYANKHYRRTNCSGVDEPVDHPNVTIVQSQFSKNKWGIWSGVDLAHNVFLHVQITRCIFLWNSYYAIFLDKILDGEDLATLKIEETKVQHNSIILHNIATFTAAIFIYRHKVYLQNVIIRDNSNTGLILLDSSAIFSGSNNVFINNSGYNGGAIASFHSDFFFTRNTDLSLVNNTAKRKGGAIYIDGVCALHILDEQSSKALNNVTLTFMDNSAPIANDIYGLNSPFHCNINIGNLDEFFSFFTDSGEISSFSTNSVGLCSCSEDDLYNLSRCFNETYNNNKIVQMNVTKYPGEIIEVPVAIVGYGGRSSYSLTDGIIDLIVNGNEISNTPYNGTYCYKLQHRLVQENSTQTIIILIESEPTNLNIILISSAPTRTAISINITLLPCPKGFQLVNGMCDCIGILLNKSAHVLCNIATKEITVTRTGPVWYGTVYNESCYITNTICGYDYCKDGTVAFTLNNSYDQCSSYRCGILCSQCSKGTSLKLGSNECGNCDSSFIGMLIFFFFAGIGLIGLIIMLDLTVSVGTINGLIFYANILKMYEHIFFPTGPLPFVSHFISWINLDLGINMCFYNGMDTYSKSWLQFVFPFYIWTLIIFIIVLCQWSMKVSKLFGSHVVPVLATLLLLSYIKLMRSIVYALSAQHISIDCNTSGSLKELRWYPDPSIRYLELKHAFLFTFALFLLIILVIPYTVVLLISPILQGYLSRYRFCSLWNKLKPFFDAYNAPYKDNLRFWTGFLLVARLPILVAVSATNLSETDKNTLLSVVLTTIAVVFITANICGGVYRIWYLNVLESLFLLNVAAVAIAATNNTYSNVYKGFLITSVCISFILFVAIIIFHIYLRFSKGGSQETEVKMQALAKGLTTLKRMETNRERKCSTIQSKGHQVIEMKEDYRSRTETSFTELRRESLILDEYDDRTDNYMLVMDS